LFSGKAPPNTIGKFKRRGAGFYIFDSQRLKTQPRVDDGALDSAGAF
jgi:hypothetical protein